MENLSAPRTLHRTFLVDLRTSSVALQMQKLEQSWRYIERI